MANNRNNVDAPERQPHWTVNGSETSGENLQGGSRQKQPKKSGGLSPALVILFLAVLVAVIAQPAGRTTLSNQPDNKSAENAQNLQVRLATNAQEQLPSQLSAATAISRSEPTINPVLLSELSTGSIFAVTTANVESFKKVLSSEVVPMFSGFAPGETGISVVDSINRLKFSLADSSSNEEMMDQMQREGQLIKNLAANDTVSETLRQKTFEEFRDSASKEMEKTSLIADPENFILSVNAMAYYLTGMEVLTTNPNEAASRDDLIEKAAKQYKKQFDLMATPPESEIAPAPTLSPNTNPTPNTGATQPTQQKSQEQLQPAPTLQSTPNQVNGPQNSSNSQNNPQINPQQNPGQDSGSGSNPPSYYKSNTLSWNLNPTVYDDMPLVLPSSLNLSGMSWSPDSIVLAMQQLYGWITRGEFSKSTRWVVYNVYQFNKDLLLFTLVREDTLKDNWNQLPVDCQNYLGSKIENPKRGVQGFDELRSYETCVQYFEGSVFSQDLKMAAELSDGSKFGGYHVGKDNKVDYLGGLWWGAGDGGVLVTGNVIEVASVTEKIQSLWNIFGKK